jgi:hypothetical protein
MLIAGTHRIAKHGSVTKSLSTQFSRHARHSYLSLFRCTMIYSISSHTPANDEGKGTARWLNTLRCTTGLPTTALQKENDCHSNTPTGCTRTRQLTSCTWSTWRTLPLLLPHHWPIRMTPSQKLQPLAPRSNLQLLRDDLAIPSSFPPIHSL